MRIELRGLGGILTGDLDSPRIDGSAIAFEDGRIVSIGDEAGHAAAVVNAGGADLVVDAGGATAVPGLWDGAAALYFGDHESQFSARGAIAASVEFGTTTLVGNGHVAVPGWIGDPRSRRELAVLTVKSWRFDRPRGIKVLPGVIEADPAWTDEDFQDLAAIGASTVLITPQQSGSAASPASARGLADRARAAGLRIGVTLGAAHPAAFSIEDVVALEPDVVLANGARGGTVRTLLAETRTSIGVTLVTGLPAATDAVCSAADRSELGRVFVGTGLPGRTGVVPGGIALFLEALSATTGLGRDQLLALASGNVARAFGSEGGVIAVGQPADVVLTDPAGEGIDAAWSTPVRASYIDGTQAWQRESA